MHLLSRVIKGARVWDKSHQLVLKEEFPVRPRHRRSETDALDTTRREAEEILAKAREEARQIVADAHKEGFQEGYREALSAANEEAEAIRTSAREVLKQAESILQEKVKLLEGELISLAIEIAEKIVAMQITLDQETVVAIAREVLQLVGDRKQMIFFANPAEVDILRSKKEEFLQLLPRRTVMEIVPDPSVKPGGFRIETEQGLVDATIDQRWSKLLEELRSDED